MGYHASYERQNGLMNSIGYFLLKILELERTGGNRAANYKVVDIVLVFEDDGMIHALASLDSYSLGEDKLAGIPRWGCCYYL